MFAIKCGPKFLNAKFYIDPNKVFDVVISDTAKVFKTRAEADRVLGLVQVYLTGRISWTEKAINTTVAARARHLKDVIKYQAKIDELSELSYKEVHKQVRDYEHKLARAQSKADSSVSSDYSRDLARLRRIERLQPCVVKMQQVVEAL